MSNRKLPVINEPASSIRKDGTRNHVHPADVSGRFVNIRRVVYSVLIIFYLVIPFIQVGGHPAIFLDVEHRRFFLFGTTATAQDFWLSFFLITGLGFALFVVTTLWGRVWCGYACPHSVFLEGVFRPIERLIEGPRNVRMKRNQKPMHFDKFWRKALKHFLFILVALTISHFLLSHFTSMPALVQMIKDGPFAHMYAFVWMLSITGVLYANFAFFREQLCLAICPYGRLQSALIDDDSLVIGYDVERGEPRGKKRDPNAGDCVDCKRCVIVCPTGIDIRNGLQMECIGCAQCIDACDEIMDKLGRDRGLVRYDSLNGLAGKEHRFIRPRLFLYIALGLLGLGVATWAFSSRTPYEAAVLRVGAPFVVRDGEVLNSLALNLVNKRDEVVTFSIEPVDPGVLEYSIPSTVEVPALEARRTTFLVTRSVEDAPEGGREYVRLRITDDADGEPRVVEVPFVSPR